MHSAPKTREEVAHVAASHFSWLRHSFLREKHSVEANEAQEAIGNKLVAAALALAHGDTVSPTEWLEAAGHPASDMAIAHELFPYLSSGNLNIMKMEFAHATLGVLPVAEVRCLLEIDGSRMFRGVELTQDTVQVRFRRLPLGE